MRSFASFLLLPYLLAMLTPVTLSASPPPRPSTKEVRDPAAGSGLIQRIARVKASNDDWLRTGVHVQPGEIVVLLASGSVRLSDIKGPVGPEGSATGAGKLEVKIGSGAPVQFGKQAALTPEDRGILKLRVVDTKYQDNAGGYDVRIIVIPASAIPEPRPISEEEE
jgi:hypothetical protein